MHNHEGRLKSMEGTNYVKELRHIYDDTCIPFYGLVGGNESPFHGNIRHSWIEKLSSPLYPNISNTDIP